MVEDHEDVYDEAWFEEFLLMGFIFGGFVDCVSQVDLKSFNSQVEPCYHLLLFELLHVKCDFIYDYALVS